MKALNEKAGLIALLLVGVMLGMGAADYSNNAPAWGAYQPTQSDTVDLAKGCRTICCEAAGDVCYSVNGGASVTQTVAAGEKITAQATRILDTGTTLTDAQMVIWQ